MSKRKKQKLPFGVKVIDLEMHADTRGVFTELFRKEWKTGMNPIQWNVVKTQKGVLRGVHVHPKHHDYLIILEGTVSVGLCDLRITSATAGRAAVIKVKGKDLKALYIPPGVAHGFYFHTRAMHIYSVSEYWDKSDELGCYWADPNLGIPWTQRSARTSRRDADLPLLSELLEQLYPTRRQYKRQIPIIRTSPAKYQSGHFLKRWAYQRHV